MSLIDKIKDNPLVSLIILCSFIIPGSVGVTSWFFTQRIENIKSKNASVIAGMTARHESSLTEIKIQLLELKHSKEISGDKREISNIKKDTSKSYMVKGKCNGNPYINVEVYVDNPPNESNKPSRSISPIIKVSGGTRTIPFTAIIKDYEAGVHRLDIYVGFPGNNGALIELELIAIEGNLEKIVHTYIVDNHATKANIGPHYPYYRTSIPFVI